MGSSRSINKCRTFLAFDFRLTGADAGTYPAFQTNNSSVQEKSDSQSSSSSSGNQPAYGPSSGHPTQVNHLMGDASVHGLNKLIDVSAYTFLITKAGNDPNPTMP